MSKLVCVGLLGLFVSFSAGAVDDAVCKNASNKLANYVEKARTLPPARRESFVLDQMSQEDLKTNSSKLGLRATHLIETSLSRREIVVNLYGYCKSF